LTYSVTLPVGAAASHVRRHDWSFWRHDVVTHVAIWRQAGSFGQLVEPVQQLVSAQVAQDDAAALKIWAAPGQLPASVAVPVWTGGVPASIGRDEPPPPAVLGVPHGTPSVDLHAPIDGGRGLLDDEHAKSVATPAAIPAALSRRRARRLRAGGGVAAEPAEAAEAAVLTDELFQAMAVVFLGPQARGLSSVAGGRCAGFLRRTRAVAPPARTLPERSRPSSLLALEGPPPDRL
jgi:hypothetical protein